MFLPHHLPVVLPIVYQMHYVMVLTVRVQVLWAQDRCFEAFANKIDWRKQVGLLEALETEEELKTLKLLGVTSTMYGTRYFHGGYVGEARVDPGSGGGFQFQSC
jgi:hypothetical protein